MVVAPVIRPYRSKVLLVSTMLLLAWWTGHFAYKLAPLGIEGHAFNIFRAAASVILLAIVALTYRSPLVHIPMAGILAEEFQIIGCTVAYVHKPWPVLPGQEKCSEAVGLPLGAMSLAALLWVAVWLLDRIKTGRYL